MDPEPEDEPAAGELDPPFPHRIRPLDWSWLREPIRIPTEPEGEQD